MGYPGATRGRGRAALCMAVVVGASVTSGAHATPAAQAAEPRAGWTISATRFGAGDAPTFLANGYLGLRVPAAGMGYSPSPVVTDAQLAGFYGQDPPFVQKRADIPIWSTLALSDGSGIFGDVPAGTAGCGLGRVCPAPLRTAGEAPWQGSVHGYEQRLDLARGLLTTRATWVSPAGRGTDLTYQVVVDRARPHVGVVRLEFRPHWSGTAVVTDLIDGRDTDMAQGADVADSAVSTSAAVINGTEAQLSSGAGVGYDPARHQIFERVTATTTGLVAGVASTLEVPRSAGVAPVAVPAAESVGQQATMHVVAGTTYIVTKYVGVTSSLDDVRPVEAARSDALSAERTGARELITAHEQEWSRLWRSDILVSGDPTLQLEVRASLFYLLESTRAGSDWSVSPGGLSGPGYNGHVFWDAETWMYPALLAMHPDIAAGVNRYREERLDVARAFAAATGFAGARFPWESALTGDDQSELGFPLYGDGTDPLAYGPTQLPSDPVDTSQFEQHVTADVALAQWQYYAATGDRRWLADHGWPVLEGTAQFWASHATVDQGGAYHIDHVMGPDEYHGDVDDSAYVNAAAATTLRIASDAARLIGQRPDPRWATIADSLLRTVPYDPSRGIHLEYDGYGTETVKQADVVMLQYPWAVQMPAALAQRDLDFYMAHTDLDGPSMTDAIHAIDAAAVGAPGCADDYFLHRSIDPFVRGPYAQFAETRTGGEFTFMTAVGGFLQEFLYGFSGLRWSPDAVVLSPTLPPQLGGTTLQGLGWHGRRFTVAIGPRSTTVTLTSGEALPVRIGDRSLSVPPGGSITVPTSRPDLAPTDDLARCRPVAASSVDPSFPALGAVDGDPATAWQARAQQASLQVDLGAPMVIDRVDVAWGAAAATVGTLDVSSDGARWRTVAPIGRLRFRPTSARFVRISIGATANGRPPQIDELSVRAD